MRGLTLSTTAAIGVGAALFLFGVFGDGKLGVDDFRTLGVAIVICVLTRAYTRESRARDEMIWQHGHDIGREIGFRAGRLAPLSRVLPLPVSHETEHDDLSLVGTADQSG